MSKAHTSARAAGRGSRTLRRLFSRTAGLGAALGVAGCALFTGLPEPVTTDQRLAQFPTENLPLERPVTIRWDAHQIPFIEAETDSDAAFALGLVHAHLRLGQLAVLRRVMEGRLSESAGPFTADIDIALRAFDFGQAADEIYASMPAESKAWLDRYVEGVNAYAARLSRKDLPHEMKLLAIDWEPWTPQDSIAIGRVGGIDINLGTLVALLQIEDADLRSDILARLQDASTNGTATIKMADALPSGTAESRGLTMLAALSKQIGKSGSNSFAVSGTRRGTGAALIANDPHLGFVIPNLWLIAGLETPTTHMVGMMVPGTPVFAFGRNRHISWGGTNLRATTSQLVDVSDLPAEETSSEEVDIGVRFWFDRSGEVTRTPYGPVMSDFELVSGGDRPFAVRWTGHTVSDEITALLEAMRAEDFTQFRMAMDSFAVPPQIFLVAEDDGDIGSMIATKVPARKPGDPFTLIADRSLSDRQWDDFYWGTDLPFSVNPDRGYFASANNRPAPDGALPFGGFFPQDERVRRLIARLEAESDLTVDEAMAIQMDTVSPLSREVLDALDPALAAWQPRTGEEAEALEVMRAWDGDYAVDSRGAAVFEAFLTIFLPEAYKAAGRPELFRIFSGLSRSRSFLVEDIRRLSAEQTRAALGPALKRASEMAAAGTAWGDLHRMEVAHFLGFAPLIGGRYTIDEFAVPGSRETVFKTAHSLTDERHEAFYGAQSRHISDMADPDENYFILYGGQDGWLNSANFADQVPLWRQGDYIRMPLSREGREAVFGKTLRLTPGA